MRVKIIKDYQNYSRGRIVQLDQATAHDLVAKGYAIITKDMQAGDYEVASGRPKRMGVDDISRRKRIARD